MLRSVDAGRVQRGRGQGDRGPRTQGPGKVGEGGRGGTNTRGAGLGQRTGVEGGSKEGGLPRELLRPVLAGAESCTRAGRRAEGQRRHREEGVPRRHEGASVGQKHKGAPQPSEPPAVRGETRQGGAQRRAAATQSHTTRARCVPATCVRSAYTVSCKR